MTARFGNRIQNKLTQLISKSGQLFARQFFRSSGELIESKVIALLH